MEVPATDEPPKCTTWTWVQAEEGKGEEQNFTGSGSRQRHTARGAWTSGGSWWVEGEGDTQVVALFDERGSGKWANNESYLNIKSYRWGGGREEEGKEQPGKC